jgi:iron complex outermembrane receptor protein
MIGRKALLGGASLAAMVLACCPAEANTSWVQQEASSPQSAVVPAPAPAPPAIDKPVLETQLPSSASYSNKDGADSTDDIVVTAQRRSENAVNVPISVAAVSGERLSTLGIQDVTSLSQVVPGFRVDFSGAFSQPTIRGVGSAVLGAGIASNVATYIDGVIRPSSLSNNVRFDDISSVQVLKGPQGTLFGRNATGGAILITTNNPSFETQARAHVSFGSYNEVLAGASVSTGFTDTLAASLAVTQGRWDGYVRDVVTGDKVGGYNNWGVRAKLLFRPSSKVEFLLAYEHLYANDFRIVGNSYNGWSAGAFDPTASVEKTRGRVANNVPQYGRSQLDVVSLKSTFDLGGVTLTSYTANQWENDFNSSDNDGSSSNILAVAWPIRERTFTQEVNLAARTGPLDWVVGAFYYRNTSQWSPLMLSVSGSPFFPYIDSRVKSTSYAGFADVTWEVASNLFITGGLRYGHDKASEFVDVLVDAAPAVTPSKSWNSLTPRAVIRYEIAPKTNIYASFSKGFKAGVFNSPTLDTAPVDPEKITAYEVGFKTSRSGIQIDTAAFYYDYTNLQVASYTATGSVLRNAASSRIYGLDAKVSARIAPGLTATLAGAYTHARYRKFPNAAGYIWSPTTAVNAVTVDASGFRVLRTPDFSGNASLDYSTPLAGGSLNLSGLYSYQSRIYFDPIQYTTQKAYGTLNLRAGWTDPSKHFTLGFFANNVTDTIYIAAVLPNTAYFGQVFGSPATYGAEFKFNF